jgi:BirA family biotin operon repressor/biotin-[acetyl-CoA-carboxylase] ligase
MAAKAAGSYPTVEEARLHPCPPASTGSGMGFAGPMPWRIKHYDILGSTNEKAREIALAGGAEGVVVTAETQTSGRGRMDRSWHSAQGRGLWLSVLLRPSVQMRRLPQLTLLAAVSVAEAIEAQTGIIPGIKWPNDILINGRKVCGILSEIADSGLEGDTPAAIIGIGLNVNQQAEEFPQELKEIATSLHMAAGRAIDRQWLLDELLTRLDRNYIEWLEQGFTATREKWIRRSATIGKEVRLEQDGRLLRGMAVDLDRDGALLVKNYCGGVHRVDSGEIQGPCLPDNLLKSKEY